MSRFIFTQIVLGYTYTKILMCVKRDFLVIIFSSNFAITYKVRKLYL